MGILSIFGGGPSGDDIRAANKLATVTPMAYSIAGIPEYQSGLAANTAAGQAIAANGAGAYDAGAASQGLGNQASATNLIGQTAAGNGPSLARANMQAGLSQQANQIQSQSMSNQGNTGGGLSQRNMLNAQANAGNSMVQNAGTASVAEQLGSQANYASAANAQTQGQMTNSANASNAGLAQNAQALGANQAGAANLTAGQSQNDAQTQDYMARDAVEQQAGRDQTNIALQAAGGDANTMGAIGSAAEKAIEAAAMVTSDEKTKTDIQQGTATDSQVGKFLGGFMDSSKKKDKDTDTRPDKGLQSANPYSMFQPGMIGKDQGILQAGGSKSNYKTGLTGSFLKGFTRAKKPDEKKQASSPGINKGAPSLGAPQYPGSMPAGTAPAQSGMQAGMSLGTPPGADPITDASGAMVPAATDMSALANMPVVPSDEACKRNIAKASGGQLSSFMQHMNPSTFQYKDQGYSPGKHLGVIAQDVDNSKVGQGMVQEGPGGMKQINVVKALGASLASLAYLNDRMDKLDGKKASKARA
jgi:hypothetical protein